VIGRTVFAAVAALVLGAGFMMAPAAEGKGGPKCGRLCRDAVSACRTATCDPITSKKDKRKCKKDCRKNAIALCNSQPQPHTADQCSGTSATGAFVN
jgi:hypothetical protein